MEADAALDLDVEHVRTFDAPEPSAPAAKCPFDLAGSERGAPSTTEGRPVAPWRSRPDRFARWLLRVREPQGEPEVHNIFSSSILLSATRCLLSYIVLPVLAPWLGTLPLVGPAIGLPVGLLALVFDVRAVRRFFLADHRHRWMFAALYVAVMAMVVGLVARDVAHLV